MNTNPYRQQPDRAFWSRAVARGFDPVVALAPAEPLLRPDDRVMSIGSCFAANLVPWLERSGIEYLRTERPHPVLAQHGENLGYADFSAAYGNVYTSRQLRQLVERAFGRFQPEEDRWYEQGAVIDPFRPGLRFPAADDREFDEQTARHLSATRQACEQATVIVMTLGLVETWVSRRDGAAYPAAPGTIAGRFDPERHVMRVLEVDEIVDDLLTAAAIIRDVNPRSRFIVTVSPVPLVATATGEHVLLATTHAKSVLRVAADRFVRALDHSSYFPSYEIVTGPQAPHDFFEADRRSVSVAGVEAVMRTLLADARDEWGADAATLPISPSRDETRESPLSASDDAASALSRRVVAAECDEALADS